METTLCRKCFWARVSLLRWCVVVCQRDDKKSFPKKKIFLVRAFVRRPWTQSFTVREDYTTDERSVGGFVSVVLRRENENELSEIRLICLVDKGRGRKRLLLACLFACPFTINNNNNNKTRATGTTVTMMMRMRMTRTRRKKEKKISFVSGFSSFSSSLELLESRHTIRRSSIKKQNDCHLIIIIIIVTVSKHKGLCFTIASPLVVISAVYTTQHNTTQTKPKQPCTAAVGSHTAEILKKTLSWGCNPRHHLALLLGCWC